MLKLVVEERHQRGLPDVTRPVFVCDHCGEEIKEAARGLYTWWVEPGSGQEDGTRYDLYTVHKGACDRGFWSSRGVSPHNSPGVMTDELTVLPVYLGANIGIVTDAGWKQARESASLV